MIPPLVFGLMGCKESEDMDWLDEFNDNVKCNVLLNYAIVKGSRMYFLISHTWNNPCDEQKLA